MIALTWFFICSMWWLAATTIGLFLTASLKYSLTARSAWFSWFFVNIIGPIFQPRSTPARKKAFKILNDSVADRNKNVPLEVMEIGIGEGANLAYYPDNCNLTVLDVNRFFESYFLYNASRYPHINYKKTIIQPAEDMRDVPDNSLDVVISTYLHCSCEDSDVVLKEVKRVLKPGGKYVFLEHVCFPQNDVGLTIQRFINPIWFLYLNGCTLDRNTAAKIRKADFAEVICDKHVDSAFWLYPIKHQIVGVATR